MMESQNRAEGPREGGESRSAGKQLVGTAARAVTSVSALPKTHTNSDKTMEASRSDLKAPGGLETVSSGFA